MDRKKTIAEPDVVLIGADIMSATLGLLLRQLDPSLSIQIIEALADVAKESSNPWNNAGTGHAALCELNYTKENADGSIDISDAATRAEAGTDVNFGELTRCMARHLEQQDGIKMATNHLVRDLERLPDGRWKLTVRNRELETSPTPAPSRISSQAASVSESSVSTLLGMDSWRLTSSAAKPASNSHEDKPEIANFEYVGKGH